MWGDGQLLRHGILILITITWGQIFVENSYGQTPENPEINTKNNNKSEEKSPFSIPVRILQTPLAELDGEKNWKRQRREDTYTEKNISVQENIAKSSENVAHYTYLQFWVSICSLVGLFGTAVFAGLAWRESKRATDEAVQTAKAAWRSVEIAEDTSRRQLRAYLTLDEVHIPDDVPKGNFMARIVIKNSGQTPAKITKIGLRAFVVTGSMVATDLSDVTSIDVTYVVGAGATASFFAAASTVIPGLDQEIFNNRMSAHIICRITYRDIYDHEHYYNFVRSIDGERRNLYGSFSVNEKFPDEFS